MPAVPSMGMGVGLHNGQGAAGHGNFAGMAGSGNSVVGNGVVGMGVGMGAGGGGVSGSAVAGAIVGQNGMGGGADSAVTGAAPAHGRRTSVESMEKKMEESILEALHGKKNGGKA